MIVKIKNSVLRQAIGLLFDLPLKGKQSRHRTKFIKKLEERAREVEKQRVELLKEHSIKDKDDNPVIKNNEYQLEDKSNFIIDLNELYNEHLVIDGGDNQETLKTVKTVLLDCEKEFRGEEALVYDYLCDQFESAENESENKEEAAV